MKDEKDKLDRLFEKAFLSFEESPPGAIKDNVFNKLLLFNTWQRIRKYIVVFLILMIFGSAAYFSGVFSSGKNKDVTNMAVNNSTLEKAFDNSIGEKNVIREATKTASQQNIPSNKIYKTKELSPNQNNVENTININPGSTGLKVTATNNNKEEVANNTKITDTKGSLIENKKSGVSQNLMTKSENKNTNPLIASAAKSSLNTKTGNYNINYMDLKSGNDIIPDYSQILIKDKTPNVSDKRNMPILWSCGLYLGHSVLQSNILQTKQQVSDDNFKTSSAMQFPSGHIGINVRGEKRNFFFDMGLQYSHLTEKVKANQLLYNLQHHQDINFLGQITVYDTNGAYWHYYWVSDASVRKIDSVWTYRVDSTFADHYDTTKFVKYDTLKNASIINTYSLIEIPLNIGWMKNLGRVNIGFSTGPVFSLLVGTKGKIPYYNTDQAELIALKQEFKPFRFGMSWQIAALLNYQLTDRMLLELSPYYRQTILAIKSKVSSSKLKNNFLGIQLGLRYYF